MKQKNLATIGIILIIASVVLCCAGVGPENIIRLYIVTFILGALMLCLAWNIENILSEEKENKEINVKVSENRKTESEGENYIDEFLKSEKYYVSFIRTNGEEEKIFEYLIPSITIDGKIWVFTKEEYAKAAVERNGADIFYYKEFSRFEFLYLCNEWLKKYVVSMSVNEGVENEKLKFNSSLPYTGDNPEIIRDTFGRKLNSYLARYRQFSQLPPETHHMKQFMELMYKNEITEHGFFVPVFLKGEVPPNAVFVSPYAKKQYEELDEKSILGFDEIECTVECKDKIDTEKEVVRLFSIATIYSRFTGSTTIPIYTDISDLKKIYDSQGAVAGFISFKEVVSQLDCALDTGSTISGVTVNPGSVKFYIDKDSCKKILNFSENSIKLN